MNDLYKMNKFQLNSIKLIDLTIFRLKTAKYATCIYIYIYIIFVFA